MSNAEHLAAILRQIRLDLREDGYREPAPTLRRLDAAIAEAERIAALLEGAKTEWRSRVHFGTQGQWTGVNHYYHDEADMRAKRHIEQDADILYPGWIESRLVTPWRKEEV